MLSVTQFQKIVRASGWYDLVVAAPFATPFTFAIVWQHLQTMDKRLGLAGNLPEIDPAHALLANLMGSVIVIWSIVRIRTPEARFGRYDGAGRVLFTIWILYGVSQGLSQVLLVFVLFEIAWGVMQLLPTKR